MHIMSIKWLNIIVIKYNKLEILMKYQKEWKVNIFPILYT